MTKLPLWKYLVIQPINQSTARLDTEDGSFALWNCFELDAVVWRWKFYFSAPALESWFQQMFCGKFQNWMRRKFTTKTSQCSRYLDRSNRWWCEGKCRPYWRTVSSHRRRTSSVPEYVLAYRALVAGKKERENSDFFYTAMTQQFPAWWENLPLQKAPWKPWAKWLRYTFRPSRRAGAVSGPLSPTGPPWRTWTRRRVRPFRWWRRWPFHWPGRRI